VTVIDRSALLPFEPQQLFVLVNDIESYPRFMDGCVGAEILRREDNVLEARLDLAKAGVSHSFSTRNVLKAPTEITLQLLDGPFEKFQGRWEFLALGDTGCKISLNLEFTMNSTLLGAAATKLFDKVTQNLVSAIEKRARQLYG
jgi:ribosome-associated toxin RatA of RatAB toxin-antitoxin module